MARNISNLPAVEPFIVDDTQNLDKRWENWREDFSTYLLATGITQEAQKKALLLHLSGKQIKEIYKPETDDFEGMCLKLDNYFRPKKNITYERYIFKEAKQKQHETAMYYVTRLRSLAESCSFHNLSESVKRSVYFVVLFY